MVHSLTVEYAIPVIDVYMKSSLNLQSCIIRIVWRWWLTYFDSYMNHYMIHIKHTDIIMGYLICHILYHVVLEHSEEAEAKPFPRDHSKIAAVAGNEQRNVLIHMYWLEGENGCIHTAKP